MNNIRDMFNALFEPRSIAVIGASEKPGSFNAGRTRLLLKYFRGRVWLVHPDKKRLFDQDAYADVSHLPETPDMAVVMVPARLVQSAIDACGRKGIPAAQIISSGFGECGSEGMERELELVRAASLAGLRLVGPNCIGLHNPAAGLEIAECGGSRPGKVGIISQSGGLAVDFAVRGATLGLHYSKLISIGNCADLDHADFLNYMATDEHTSVIGIYVESVKDGPRFREALENACRIKPVVILKGGRTRAGSRQAASHTGALANSYAVWRALFRQTGAIEAKSADELLDYLLALQSLKPTDGKVAMVGNGGGATVLAADVCSELGLEFAHLSIASAEKLLAANMGASRANLNPLDLNAMQLAAGDGQSFGEILRIFAADPAVGVIIFHLNLVSFANQGDITQIMSAFMAHAIDVSATGVNVVAVLRYSGLPELENQRCSMSLSLANAGIPVFMTIDEALRAAVLVCKNRMQAEED